MQAFELYPYIQKLIAATNTGAARWTQSNPTTLSWRVVGSTPAHVVLQKIRETVIVTDDKGQAKFVPVDNYQLQVIDGSTSEEVLTANGSTDVGLNGQLAFLFDAATTAATKRALDFLEGIIPPGISALAGMN